MAKKTTPTMTPPGTDQAAGQRCRSCDSTDLLVVRKLTDQPFAGFGPDGRPYTSIIRRRVQCRHCGMHQITIDRPYDPKKWVGKQPA